ncbi:SUKH-4 family immunity protein [Streptomyces sp. NPDC001811]
MHEPTRRAPAPGERLDGHGLIGFRPLTGPSLLTVRDHVAGLGGEPAELDPDLAALPLIGRLVVEGGEDGEEVVLDAVTGRVFTMWLYAESPGGAELFPLAPSVGAPARFLTAVDDFRGLRGRFAGLAGSTGPEAVAAGEHLLTSVFAEEEWGEDGWGPAGPRSGWARPIPAFWRIAAVIRPLGLIAGPGRGLTLELPEGLLDGVFGTEGMVRLTDDQLPPALGHAPTRRFLTEVGLPRDGFMFYGPPAEPLVTLPEDWARSRSDPRPAHLWHGGEQLPPDAEHLVVPGGLVHDFDLLIEPHRCPLPHRTRRRPRRPGQRRRLHPRPHALAAPAGTGPGQGARVHRGLLPPARRHHDRGAGRGRPGRLRPRRGPGRLPVLAGGLPRRGGRRPLTARVPAPSGTAGAPAPYPTAGVPGGFRTAGVPDRVHARPAVLG